MTNCYLAPSRTWERPNDAFRKANSAPSMPTASLPGLLGRIFSRRHRPARSASRFRSGEVVLRKESRPGGMFVVIHGTWR